MLEKKAELDYLVDQIKGNYSLYFDYIWKTIQSNLVAIGWLLTSKDIRSNLKHEPRIQCFLIIIVILLLIINCRVAYRFYTRSKKFFLEIKNRTTFTTFTILNSWEIQTTPFIINLFITSILFVLTLTLLIFI